MPEKIIYLDNAATTAVYPEAAKIASEYGIGNFFNPSALYSQSVEVAKAVKRVRDTIKTALNAPDGELYFLSGGTEADNTALFCTKKPKGSRIIVGAGEHDAIVSGANVLKEQGYDVCFAPVNADGSVNQAEFEKLLNDNVSLVSIMHVSNETGAVNDVAKFARLSKKYSPDCVFHSDGVQAFCKIQVNLRALGVDLYSVSGHKIHAPKGIGCLFVKKGVSIKPLVFGGGQEKGFRSGTENTPAIMALGCAVERNLSNFDANYSAKLEYREYFCKKMMQMIDDIVVITPMENSAPNILSVAFKDVRGEVLLHSLEKYGVLVGIGSACSSHKESRFKALLKLDERHKDGIVRFSTSEFNNMDEIDFVVDAIKAEYEKLKQFKRV